MLEGIPKRSEVHLIGRFHLSFGLLRFVRTPPVDVVVSGYREPRAGEFVHDGLVFLHLRHPDVLVAVTIDEVADGHDEVGFQKIGVAHGIGEDSDSVVGASGAIAVDDKAKGVLLVGKRELHLALARGVESVRGGFNGFVLLTVTMKVMVVTNVWIDRWRIGKGGRGAETEKKKP